MNTEPAQKSKWGKVGTVVLSVFSIGLFVAGMAYVRTGIPTAAAHYDENLQAARTAGLPLTREEADILRQVPEGENGARLFNNLPELGFEVSGMDSVPQTFDSKWKTLEPFVQQLLAASQKKHLIFPESDYDAPVVAPDGPFRLAQWNQVLCWRAEVAARNRDVKSMSDLLFASARLANLMDQDPDFRLQSLRASMASAIDRVLARLITKHGDDLAFQQIISRILEVLDKPYDLRPAYKFEHWLDIRRVLLRTGELLEPTGQTELEGMRFIPRYARAFKSRIHARYATMLREYPSNILDYENVERLNYRCFDPYSGQSMNSYDFAYSGNRFSEIVREIRAEVAKRCALAVALAVKRDHLSIKQALKELGPKGNDIDGMPIRIKKLPQGWIVYSVGDDVKDDGGQERRYNSPDWVVHLTAATVPKLTK